ncbi:hypothetical protein FCX32_17245 [Escherichia coli]|nr:hypothetical protein [Escherichia coli]
MHTPIGVKPVAGSKEWREGGEKKGFGYIFKTVSFTHITLPPKKEGGMVRGRRSSQKIKNR